MAKQGLVKPVTKVWEKQKRFCDEYLIDSNATAAAIRAGYSAKGARAVSSRMLTYTYIKEYLAEKQHVTAKNLDITREGVIRVLHNLINFDPRKLFDAIGNLKPVSEIDNESIMAIAGIEINEDTTKPKGKTIIKSTTAKLKFSDRLAAVNALLKANGWNAADKHEHSGTDGKPIQTQINVVFTDFTDGK